MGKGGGQKRIVALVGNPNVGKSSLFNALTGLHHHTGNWSGKTVEVSSGRLRRSGTAVQIVDLPGTYSLAATSAEEHLAAEFLASGQVDCAVVVCDATALERNLILALQVLRLGVPTVVCVNLVDEAERQGILPDMRYLSELLAAPVVATCAVRRQGLRELTRQIELCLQAPRAEVRTWEDPIMQAQRIAAACVRTRGNGESWRIVLDRMLVSRRHGVPILLGLLFILLWLTVRGANYPSEILSALFDHGYAWMMAAPLPAWLKGFLLDGVYATAARVLAVMLPPMAIFFSLFTVLEDVGYLPRMAFLLDGKMRRCGGCGKQALTLCMGMGCNAVGVMGCRILDTPKQRLTAILTNAMVPCNGRFATLIVLAASAFGARWSALAVAGAVVLGFLGAMVTTGVLSKRKDDGAQRFFLLELPPLRRPRIGQIMVRSLLDRTCKMALRAVAVAAPAGGLIWLLEQSGALGFLASALQPMGAVLGLNGVILLAFVLSFPANELLLPLIWMIDGTAVLGWPTAICAMVLTVFHWPCSTTLLTVYRETGSVKSTVQALLLPTAVGVGLCFLLNLVFSATGIS